MWSNYNRKLAIQRDKLFLPGMLRRGSGRILNVGSTGSFAPGPLNAVYCATKVYVLSLSEANRLLVLLIRLLPRRMVTLMAKDIMSRG